MIRVTKSYEDIPAGLTSPSATARKEQLMREGNAHDADNGTYSHASVKAALNVQYGEKCAYCERLIEEQADRRVDHYRPRKALNKGNQQHQGYYWLTYEWSNLILACSTCNGKKSNHFPVDGVRVTSPPTDRRDWLPTSAPMAGELPLLLNPEVDDPCEHLDFFLDGQIKTRNSSQRGEKTIKICQLDRKELTLARLELIKGFRDELKDQIVILMAQPESFGTKQTFDNALTLGFQTIVTKIKKAKLPTEPFSRVGWHINNDPEGFLLEYVPDGEPRKIVRLALKRFLGGEQGG